MTILRFAKVVPDLITLIAIGALVATTAQAAESEYIHQPHLSARVMGMGGAFTALADDYNALYYNAAGLARLTKTELNLNLSVGLTPSLINFTNNLSSAGSDVNNLTNLLLSHLGDHYGARLGMGETYVGPGWGFGLQPVDVTVELDINGNAGAAIGVQAYQDSTIQFGKAWNIGGKNISLGFSPKIVYRAFIEENILALDLAANSANVIKISDVSEGVTVDTDLGFMYTVIPPEEGWWEWLQYAKPTFGFAIRNLVDEGFLANEHVYNGQSSSIQNADGKLGRRFDVGSRFELPEFWAFKPRVLVDFRDIASRFASFNKCLHMGAEFPWKASEHITGAYRLGLSQGYFTAGFSLYLGILQLDLATYSEEIGTDDAPNQSRRYMAQFSLDF